MKTLSRNAGKAALVVSVIALLCSLTGFAPAAGFVITSSKQIRPGVIVTTDLRKGAVTSSDVRTGAVKSPDLATSAVQSSDIGTGQVQTGDIGEGQVQPADVTAPEPEQVELPTAPADEVSSTFAKVADVVTYTKEDPTSVLEIQWNGSASAGFSGCVFQLRVDGQPSGNAGGSEVFVSAGSTVSVAAVGLFDGLPAGPHEVSVYARATIEGGGLFPCTVGPQSATIKQTFLVGELVV
jgi:hypothetical protein